jgi:hypothetical protein
MGFDLFKYLGDRGAEVAGALEENFPGALRMAGSGLGLVKDQVMDLAGQAVDYVQDIPDKGAIPIPLTEVSKDARTGAGYLKSLAGPVGMPFRILDNPGSSEFYQRTIDAAKYDPVEAERLSGVPGQHLIFNENIDDLGVYDELGRDLSNKDFGRYTARVDGQGNVIVEDEYDTNRSALWHWNRLSTGKDKEGRDLDPLSRAISGASGLHKKLTDAGWTNPHPFGAPGSVRIGTFNR